MKFYIRYLILFYIATFALTLYPSCSSEISYEDAIKNNDFEVAINDHPLAKATYDMALISQIK